MEKKRKLEVKVPAGIDTGKLIRMPGEGAPGNLGGPSGDLYLAIEVDQHKTVQRRGHGPVCEEVRLLHRCSVGRDG